MHVIDGILWWHEYVLIMILYGMVHREHEDGMRHIIKTHALVT